MIIRWKNLKVEEMEDWDGFEKYVKECSDDEQRKKWILERKEEILNKFVTVCLLISKDVGIVGYIAFYKEDDRSLNWLYRVGNIFLNEKYRRFGIGSLLLKIMEIKAHLEEIDGIMVIYDEKNKKLDNFFYYKNNYNCFAYFSDGESGGINRIAINYLYKGYLLDKNKEIQKKYKPVEE